MTQIKTGLIIFILVTLITLPSCSDQKETSSDGMLHLNTKLIGNESNWSFVGVPKWKEDDEGIIYPPVWSNPLFDRGPDLIPHSYAHELAREDYAFIKSKPLEDIDITVEYKCYYGAVIHGGVVFRAIDSRRFYVLEIRDNGRKGSSYDLVLSVQDSSGYRREIAIKSMPHSVVPDRFVQGGRMKNKAEWFQSGPDWVRVRVQATGSFIRVSMNGQIAYDLRDTTYPIGRVGLIAIGAVAFRNLEVKGTESEEQLSWKKYDGEFPKYFLPGGEQPVGFNAYPVVCRTDDNKIIAVWSHSDSSSKYEDGSVILCTYSDDEGKTWSKPKTIYKKDGYGCTATSLYAHRNGTVSLIFSAIPRKEKERGAQTLVIRSKTDGKTWSASKEFLVAGKPLSDYKNVNLYSIISRLSNNNVVMTGYQAVIIKGAKYESNATRKDQTLLFRSYDDGFTWGKPTFIDKNNYDHNECMVAEVKPGHLIAFMRTLRAPYMWKSTSNDYGHTWTPLVQSEMRDVSCPFLMKLSEGPLILGSRGPGTFINISYDDGKTWSKPYRISPASAMMSMVEMPDGRVLILMHEGYRWFGGKIRGQFFRVTKNGPVAAVE